MNFPGFITQNGVQLGDRSEKSLVIIHEKHLMFFGR